MKTEDEGESNTPFTALKRHILDVNQKVVVKSEVANGNCEPYGRVSLGNSNDESHR